MAIDNLRYRQLQFVGARILQARELNWLQEMDQGVAVTDNETPVDGQLQSQYRQGATYNVTASVAGLVVTLAPTDGINPMLIFVRDRWEIYPRNNDDVTDTPTGTHPANHTITLTNVETKIYLNWELRIRTGGLTGDDPSLTDVITNEAVASAGELILHISDTDTSAASLNAGQLAKNTSPVPLFVFTNNGTSLIPVVTDNVLAQSRATMTHSGFVTTTTTTPTVVSTDDPRMTDSRSPADGSVHDSSIRMPLPPGGTNADGTPIYTLHSTLGDGLDIGGVNAAKIVYVAGTQLVSDFIGWVKIQVTNLLSSFAAHFTAALGQGNTHPIPTAAQVGATPLSHVGQPLGLSTSHPPVVNANSGGFRMNRTVGGGAAYDAGFGIFDPGGIVKVSLNHDGDIRSNASGAYTSNIYGSLYLISTIAAALTQHVNQVSHANPHGLAAIDIGAVDKAYVDTTDTNILAASKNFTNSLFATGFGISLGYNGYIKLPTALGGLIVQWCQGAAVGSDNTQNVFFPIAFPHVCLTVQTSTITSNTNIVKAWGILSITNSYVGLQFMRRGDEGSFSETPMVLAIGY